MYVLVASYLLPPRFLPSRTIMIRLAESKKHPHPSVPSQHGFPMLREGHVERRRWLLPCQSSCEEAVKTLLCIFVPQSFQALYLLFQLFIGYSSAKALCSTSLLLVDSAGSTRVLPKYALPLGTEGISQASWKPHPQS